MSQDVTPREALMRLGGSTAEAVAQVLETFVPGAVERGDVTVISDGQSPFQNIPPGSLASSVSYIDGVTGANIFVMAPAGARALAVAMGVPPESKLDEDLSELELSAVAESANQTMAAAASAISLVIGQEIEISPPDTKVLTGPAAAAEAYGKAPHAISTTFLIAGEACRLIQLVPAAFVMRMVRAIDELSMQHAAGADGVNNPGRAAEGDLPETLGVQEALGGIELRVWAELGRTKLPLGGSPRASARRCRRSRSRGGCVGGSVRQRAALRAGPPARHRRRRMGDRHRRDRCPQIRPRAGRARRSLSRIPETRSSKLMARVLVVDDAAFMRKVVSDALASGGHEVVGQAGNGEEAVERFQELRPELTTLDITMPQKDGLAALADIMAIDPGARVLMCSALGQESKVIESIKLGAKDFVVKPFQPTRLLEAVGKALS